MPRFSPALVVGALLLAAACTDRSPVSPEPQPGEEPGGGTPGRPVHLMAVSCTVNVREGVARCDDAPPPEGPATDLILGGQNRYVNLEVGAVSYDQNTQSYLIDVAIRNLIPQALGTVNGTTLDPNGVRVFLQAGPNATLGSGNVSVIPDGFGTFTASNQPYYQYNAVLDPFEVSPSRTWAFQMPTTVTSFAFTAYVSAAVQFPDGWVDVSPGPLTMHPHEDLKLIPQARDAAGNAIEGILFYNWTTSDSTLVTVTPSGGAGGMVGSVRAGTATITVTSGVRTGSAQVHVTGMQRIWQGDVSTNYHTRGNWEHNVVPVAQDTIVIPNPSPNYPLLAQNAQVSSIHLAEGALLNLGAFDMTASRHVVSSTTGGTGITSTTGRLFLAGTAGEVRGRVPRLRVSGTYSLTGNLWVVAPLQVEGGRLTNYAFRIESNNTL